MKVEKKSLASSLVKARNQSVSDTDSSPMSLPQTPSSQQPHPTASIPIRDDIGDSLLELYELFNKIIYQVKTNFVTFVTQQPAQLQNIIRFTEDAINPSQMIRLEASNVDEYFHHLRPYYDFLECRVITSIVKQFIGGKLEECLQKYSAKARKFRRTAPIKQLAKDLHQIVTFNALSAIEAKLETPWEKVAIEGLYLLIKNLLPTTAQSQCSLMNNIVISPGCLLLKYGIEDEGQIDTIIEHVQQNMHLLIGLFGIFQLSVDGKCVIFEDEDLSFSFTTALIDATKASNNTVIQFLLDIGTNIDYQDDEGLTALMWAVLINNVGTTIQLLESGADVHIIQRKYFIHVTALMLACMGNKSAPPPGIQRLSDDYSETIKVLLSYGADPLVGMDNGYGELLSSFDKACTLNNSDIVEILLTDHNIPPEATAKGLYWALLHNATNTIKLLQSKLPNVDPLAITLGVSCGEGDEETVKSLMKQGVDPSTDIVHGLTPLMIASNHRYIDVVDILLQHGANVNMVNVHGHSALDFAKKDDGIALWCLHS